MLQFIESAEYDAAKKNDCDAIVALVRKKACMDNGILTHAVRHNVDNATIQCLVDCKANPNAGAVHTAMENGDTRLVQCLLSLKASPQRHVGIHSWYLNRHVTSDTTAAMLLLLRAKAKPNFNMTNNYEDTQLLLQAKADPRFIIAGKHQTDDSVLIINNGAATYIKKDVLALLMEAKACVVPTEVMKWTSDPMISIHRTRVI
jgi:hypothetical protein